MWIKAHFVDNGDVIWLQTQNIAAVYPDQGNNKYRGQTVIQFPGEKNNFIKVKESVNEIGEQIIY